MKGRAWSLTRTKTRSLGQMTLEYDSLGYHFEVKALHGVVVFDVLYSSAYE